MKKIVIIIFFLVGILSYTLQCQTFERFSKGTLYTGGSVSFKSEQFEDINSIRSYHHYFNTLDSEISVGYFLLNKFSLGAKLNYYFESQIFDNRSNPDKNLTRDLLFGPVIKYYSKYNLFAFTSFAYGISKYGYDDSLVEWRTTLWNAGIGYSLMLNKTVAVEPQIIYRVIEKKDQAFIEGTEIFKGFIFSMGFQIYFHNPDN
ncbi:MAG: hypothetical protein LC649_10810 [Bacteroidales bacterium]|nr:hypothetical protein [Bacteroidales bacterium]